MGKINVAIVDDNERMIHMLDNILRTDENIEVVGKAEDGVQALEVIRQNEPDVVLLDLIMPKLDGLEVMKKINSDTNLKKHPAFIVISAIGKETITENAFSQGAVYFIMKPFENETVINKIKQVTGVGTAPAAGNGGSGTPAADWPSRPASNFLAVQGMMETMTICLGSMPIFSAYQVLMVAPNICWGDLQVERLPSMSG